MTTPSKDTPPCVEPAARNSGSTPSEETTCHMLPCNIDFEGMAKTHLFFKPVHVEDGIFASSFRGRGLLATRKGFRDEDKTGGHHPYLLSLEDNQIEVKASISNMMEWQHEHNLKSIMYKENDSSRLQVAKDWMELSDALHEPLPLE
ncbi:unnamed protein product [Pseudo-nitzschia multistriata]|uniref:Uncharacterized protein n=1 Tax=Pseudo-nitzschia multistriata TaxID=183589 RepID=A0A448YVQ8_9STRA|nr:unnamed protein product [Pseudo-nitzschia multistriata]